MFWHLNILTEGTEVFKKPSKEESKVINRVVLPLSTNSYVTQIANDTQRGLEQTKHVQNGPRKHLVVASYGSILLKL